MKLCEFLLRTLWLSSLLIDHEHLQILSAPFPLRVGHHKGYVFTCKMCYFLLLVKRRIKFKSFWCHAGLDFFEIFQYHRKWPQFWEFWGNAGPSGDAEDCWRTINPPMLIVITAKMSTSVLGLEHAGLGVIKFPFFQTASFLWYIHLRV